MAKAKDTGAVKVTMIGQAKASIPLRARTNLERARDLELVSKTGYRRASDIRGPRLGIIRATRFATVSTWGGAWTPIAREGTIPVSSLSVVVTARLVSVL